MVDPDAGKQAQNAGDKSEKANCQKGGQAIYLAVAPGPLGWLPADFILPFLATRREGLEKLNRLLYRSVPDATVLAEVRPIPLALTILDMTNLEV